MSIMNQGKKWLTRIIVVMVLIIVFQNMDPAPVELLFWNVNMPLAPLLAIIALCGFIVGWAMKRRKSAKSPPKTS